jgi:hypothetical protein
MKFSNDKDYPLTVANDETHDLSAGLRRWFPELFRRKAQPGKARVVLEVLALALFVSAVWGATS